MTLKERVIVETYTGYVMTSPEERDEVYKYIAELMGRPVFTHELANAAIVEQLKEKALPDFKALCITDEKWEKAKQNIHELIPFYIMAGMAGGFGLLYLRRLMERYTSGERTIELYEAMIAAK